MRIVITWVFNSSGGSVPVVALFHASVDTTASAAVLTAFYPGIDGRLVRYIGRTGGHHFNGAHHVGPMEQAEVPVGSRLRESD